MTGLVGPAGPGRPDRSRCSDGGVEWETHSVRPESRTTVQIHYVPPLPHPTVYIHYVPPCLTIPQSSTSGHRPAPFRDCTARVSADRASRRLHFLHGVAPPRHRSS